MLDVGLPDARGLDLVEIWQQRIVDEELVVIVVSGQDDEQMMIDSLRLGVYDYLIKPVRPQILMAKVFNAVRLHMSKRAARHLSQHLSAVVDSVPDGLLVTDADRRYSRCGKLPNAKLSVEFRPGRLLPLLSDTVEMNSGGSAAKRNSLRFIFDQTLDEITLVLVDEDRFRQIMANFLSHAMKFSSENSEITVRAEALDESHVRVSVTDQGPGIPENFRDKVFRPFSQAEDSTNRHKGGSGLGLSIVKALAESMKGKVGFESTPDHGSTFFVILLRQTGLSDFGEGAV